MHKRAPIIVIIVLLLAAGGWWAYSTWAGGGTNASATTLTGTVEADEFSVATVISGRVIEANLAEGNAVKKGDVLYVLDSQILKLQVEQAKAGVTAAKSAYTQSVKNGDAKADIAAAKARWDQAIDAQRMAEVQLTYAKVTAPADGVVTAVAVNVGENAGPGKTLATISDPKTLRVSVYVPETDIGTVKIGDTAKLTTDSVATPFSGKVTFIASQAEFTPNNIETKDQRVKLVYEVRVEFSDDKGVLKSGMPVDVVLSPAGQ